LICGREESFFSSRMYVSTWSGVRKVALACTCYWRGIFRSRQLIATTDKLQLVREMKEENMITRGSIWLGCVSRNPQLGPLFDFFRRRAFVVLLGYLSWYKPRPSSIIVIVNAKHPGGTITAGAILPKVGLCGN
jgi:hypothetical protein